MRRAPGLLACLLALALAVTGCTGKDGEDGAAPTPTTSDSSDGSTVSHAGDPGLGDPGVAATITDEDLISLLAGAGVATYDDPADADPVEQTAIPGVVKVTGWQLQNMRRQLNSGRGYLGRDLDDLTADTGAGAQPVPISVVLAAWLQAAETPAADAGRALMGERDWGRDALDLAYPDAVLTLFTADLTSEMAAGSSDLPGDSGASPAAYVQPPVAGTCSTVSDFIQSSFQNVVQILKFEADGGVTGVLATIWNTIIDIAASAAQIALGAVTSTLMAPIKQVAGVLSLLSAASSLLVPWQITPGVTPSGNLQPGTAGEATATVDPGPVNWPADLTDCANVLLGIALPELGSASGSKATWTVDDVAGTVTYGSTETTVDSNQQAKLAFSTVPEDPALATGPELLHYVGFGVKVERAQVGQLIDLIDGLLVSSLPEPVLTVVQTLLGPLESKTRAELAQLASVEGPVSSVFTVTHLPPDPTTPPGTEPTPDECVSGPAATIPDGTWQGPIVLDVVGTGEGATGQINSTGKGEMKLTVKEGKVYGPWKVTWRSSGTIVDHGIKIKIVVDGKAGGTASGSAKQPTMHDNWSIKGGVLVGVGGNSVAAPFEHSGNGKEYLKVTDSTCDVVNASFVPSFNTKGNPSGVSFRGNATWSGRRVG